MKLRLFHAIGLSGLLCASIFAQTAPPKPALPAGHPDIAGQQRSGSLPAGHPDISGAGPSTRPAAQFGSLAFRATQGTKDAKPIGEESVALEMYVQGQVIHRVDGKLDKSGSIVFSRLPLGVAFQPVVTLVHDGVPYQAVGDVMDAYHAGEQIGQSVFEKTDKQPEWNVHMRHVMVQPEADGVHVVEVLAVMTAGDRVWPGVPQKSGKPVTFAVDLPAGAQQVQIENGGNNAIRVDNGRIVSSLPLFPGVSQYQFTYTLPVKAGQAKLEIVEPGVVKNLMLVVPDNGTFVTAQGLQASGKYDMGNGKAQVFSASELKAGDKAVVTITVPGATKADAGGVTGIASSNVAKIVAGMGGGLGLAIGTGYVLLKPAKVGGFARR